MAWAYGSDWRVIRKSVLDRDAHRCQIGLPGCTKVASHVDHIVPLAEGGARLDPDNLRASCPHCNLTRSAGRTAALVAALEATGTNRNPLRW